MAIRFYEASNVLRVLGISLRRTKDGEFRVAYAGRGHEASAYYTNDLADAVQTGVFMADIAQK